MGKRSNRGAEREASRGARFELSGADCDERGLQKVEQARLEELARRVYADRKLADERAKRIRTVPASWYMMNLSHPVVRILYDNWKAGLGLQREGAPGDTERTLFELGLMNEETLREIEEYLDRVEAVRGMPGRACREARRQAARRRLQP